MRSTHTYVVMEVSAATYDEIRHKMLEAEYGHAVHVSHGSEVVDMHGLALKSLPVSPAQAGTLFVGLSADGTEVVINHPKLDVDAKGAGHIVFSPDQARGLASLLNKWAAKAKGL